MNMLLFKADKEVAEEGLVWLVGMEDHRYKLLQNQATPQHSI